MFFFFFFEELSIFVPGVLASVMLLSKIFAANITICTDHVWERKKGRGGEREDIRIKNSASHDHSDELFRYYKIVHGGLVLNSHKYQTNIYVKA